MFTLSLNDHSISISRINLLEKLGVKYSYKIALLIPQPLRDILAVFVSANARTPASLKDSIWPFHSKSINSDE